MRTKEDAFAIRRVTIEIGNARGADTIIEIHPPSQTATVRAHWPGGEFRDVEHIPLDAMLDVLHGLLKSKGVAASSTALPKEAE